uniref:Uncharacterized protein n=1 Tax=Anguilla anguilla TaxID=7936 RepID=A0A0E9V8Z0_ANGAN
MLGNGVPEHFWFWWD